MPDRSTPPVITCSDHAFFLDLDGTLAEIVARPEQAMIADTMKDLIRRLSVQTNGAVAVVSGRSLDDIDRLISPLELPAAGSHGQELRGGGADAVAPSGEIAPDVVHIIAEFATQRGLLAEQKPGSVALHYRSAPEYEAECKALIDGLVSGDDRYRAVHGKMVSELAQRACDKGTAIAAFAKTAPFAGRTPVMVGDDVTDEDGFRMAQSLGGIGIKIGEGATDASHRLPSIPAFAEWLADILR
ncbi:trehalose-phosphatase [Pseudosulfitobacter koreensis]|uniref:Trehalose 6-phosphate phosphatase n=1 Tax=Pseudosulfitobacter koreensis TaxID=2968472 RepID=A0ABT1Z0N1_9RHOB|nr:trehalose-phosphatase [Pseudosulfitobacter koreense]MCR8826695.1 trehalose-phosphatase [Pseudosulfitobacter koreense]